MPNRWAKKEGKTRCRLSVIGNYIEVYGLSMCRNYCTSSLILVINGVACWNKRTCEYHTYCDPLHERIHVILSVLICLSSSAKIPFLSSSLSHSPTTWVGGPMDCPCYAARPLVVLPYIIGVGGGGGGGAVQALPPLRTQWQRGQS